MIYRGNKVLDGTLESIQDRYGSDTIRVRVEGNGFDPQTIPGVEKVTDFGRCRNFGWLPIPIPKQFWPNS
jgi:hypothetical protein